MPFAEENTWYWLLLFTIPEAYTDEVIFSSTGCIDSCLLLQEKSTNKTKLLQRAVRVISCCAYNKK
jgi:hypothetical protein